MARWKSPRIQSESINHLPAELILAKISISATSADSRTDFCKKVSLTDLNFGLLFSH